MAGQRRSLFLRRLPALLLGAAVLLPVPPAARAEGPTAAAVPRLVRTPGGEEVWLVKDGRRTWIADLESFRARGYRWDDVETVAPTALAIMPVEGAVHQQPLLRDGATAAVYLVTGGLRRWVPDVTTFRAMGLRWERVETATSAALARHAAGPPLALAAARRPPSAVTLPPLPAPRPPLGGQSGRSAAAPRRVDPRLERALQLLDQYELTRAWPAWLERATVSLVVGEVSGGLAGYNARTNTITLHSKQAAASPQALAAILAHESVHALYYHRLGDARQRPGRLCIEEEADSFAWQAAVWAHIFGLGGKPEPADDVEREHNLVLQRAQDGALDGTVITNWTYMMRCYFPDFGSDE